MRSWVEATHIAHLFFTRRAAVVIGGLSGSHVKFCFTQWAHDFRHFLWLDMVNLPRLVKRGALCSARYGRSWSLAFRANVLAGITEDNFWRHFAWGRLALRGGFRDRDECACLVQEGGSKAKQFTSEPLLTLILGPVGGRSRGFCWRTSWSFSLLCR